MAQIKDLTTVFDYDGTAKGVFCSTGGIDKVVTYANLKANILAGQEFPAGNARLFDASYRLNGDYDEGDMIAGATTLTGTGGRALFAGQIVLRYNDTNQQNNGLWQIQTTGSAIRYSKANTGGKLYKSYTFIDSGTYVDDIYYCTNYAPVLGTDPVYFVERFFLEESINSRQKVAYAEIYVSDGTTAQTIPTGATYTKVTAYTTNGQSENCNADATNDKITITETGKYYVGYTASYTADTNNVTFRGAVFLGGTEQANVHSGGQIGLTGAMRSTACQGIINVTSVPVDVDVRIRHDNGGNVAITHIYASLTVQKISG